MVKQSERSPRSIKTMGISLQQFNFKIIHRKRKEHVVPDCLSRTVLTINNMKLNKVTNDKWYEKMCERVRIDPLTLRSGKFTFKNCISM